MAPVVQSQEFPEPARPCISAASGAPPGVLRHQAQEESAMGSAGGFAHFFGDGGMVLPQVRDPTHQRLRAGLPQQGVQVPEDRRRGGGAAAADGGEREGLAESPERALQEAPAGSQGDRRGQGAWGLGRQCRERPGVEGLPSLSAQGARALGGGQGLSLIHI
eukprot:1573185-Alexandrium_andersonii.AAC.1